MSKDILEFTKQLSGIDDLVNYVVNCIDQNMILYRILKNVNCKITTTQTESSLSYNIDKLSDDEIENIKSIPTEQNVIIYNTPYKVLCSIHKDNTLEISILVV